MDAKKRSTILSGASIGVALGAIAGGLIGYYGFQNLPIGLAIGVAVGVVLGSAFDFCMVMLARKKKQKLEQRELMHEIEKEEHPHQKKKHQIIKHVRSKSISSHVLYLHFRSLHIIRAGMVINPQMTVNGRHTCPLILKGKLE